VEAHTNLGAALAQLGRVQEALPHFEAACRLEPDDLPARGNLARARATLGLPPDSR
jgi:Flp pilus assembly protein TadD